MAKEVLPAFQQVATDRDACDAALLGVQNPDAAPARVPVKELVPMKELVVEKVLCRIAKKWIYYLVVITNCIYVDQITKQQC